MLGIFSSVVSPPEELVAAGSRTPSPKTTAVELLNRFVESKASAVSLQVGARAVGLHAPRRVTMATQPLIDLRSSDGKMLILFGSDHWLLT
ncbi:hypothetical protein SESBI_08870 [Sesbania bispinosa]|nr:hypothetical protein SESBI_08870 [Sesbania bispinosa]